MASIGPSQEVTLHAQDEVMTDVILGREGWGGVRDDPVGG